MVAKSRSTKQIVPGKWNKNDKEKFVLRKRVIYKKQETKIPE
jgi:hypothetical protein